MFGTPRLLVKARKGANGRGSTFTYPMLRLRPDRHALFSQDRRTAATSRDADRASAARPGGVAGRAAAAGAGRAEGTPRAFLLFSVTGSGKISGGALTGITVTGDMAGTIVAQGAGTINGLSMGSLSGAVNAIEDPDANPATGIGSGMSETISAADAPFMARMS